MVCSRPWGTRSTAANACRCAQAILAKLRPSPAELDAKRFSLHWSVDFWQNYTVPEVLEDQSATVTDRHALLA